MIVRTLPDYQLTNKRRYKLYDENRNLLSSGIVECVSNSGSEYQVYDPYGRTPPSRMTIELLGINDSVEYFRFLESHNRDYVNAILELEDSKLMINFLITSIRFESTGNGYSARTEFLINHYQEVEKRTLVESISKSINLKYYRFIREHDISEVEFIEKDDLKYKEIAVFELPPIDYRGRGTTDFFNISTYLRSLSFEKNAISTDNYIKMVITFYNKESKQSFCKVVELSLPKVLKNWTVGLEVSSNNDYDVPDVKVSEFIDNEDNGHCSLRGSYYSNEEWDHVSDPTIIKIYKENPMLKNYVIEDAKVSLEEGTIFESNGFSIDVSEDGEKVRISNGSKGKTKKFSKEKAEAIIKESIVGKSLSELPAYIEEMMDKTELVTEIKFKLNESADDLFDE